MKIRFLYCEFENWGEVPRQQIPLVDGVVAVVGENGSGKSTFVDGLKLLLGNATLEDNRTPEDYVPEDAGHAYVLAGTDNSPDAAGRRPWDDFGYGSDVVSLCCFLQLESSGRWDKTYYIVDGPFDPQKDRQVKPAFKPGDYQKVMEIMGCTKTFYRLMALDPDKVKSIIKLKPRDLFRDVLNITGDRTLAENLARHKQELKQTEERLTEVSRKLYDKRREVDQLLQQKREVEAYQEHLSDAARFDAVARKHALRQARSNHSALTKERTEVAGRLQTAYEALGTSEHDERQAQAAVAAAAEEVGRLQEETKNLAAQHLSAEQEAAICKGKIEAHNEAVEKAAAIVRPAAELNEEASRAEQEAAGLAVKIAGIDVTLRSVAEQLKQAESGRDYPEVVSQFLRKCLEHNIQPKVVADALEFKDPKWQRAIESILGPDRFCLVVRPDELDTMFDLVEQTRYRSWVDTGYAGTVPAPRPGSALELVTITDPSVYKFVKILERYELAADKHEARRIRERGGWAITPSATVWTDRGIRNIDCGELYCGKETRRQRISDLSDQKSNLLLQVEKAKKSREGASAKAQICRTQAGLWDAARQAEAALEPLKATLGELELRASTLKGACVQLEGHLTEALQRAEVAKTNLTNAQAATQNAKSIHHGLNARWVDLGNSLNAAEAAGRELEARLAEVSPDRDSWAFLEEDSAAFLATSSGFPETPEELGHWLSANLDLHRRAVEEFEAIRKPVIDFLMLRGLDGKQRQLKDLEDEYRRVEYEVRVIQDHLGVTKNQHRVSILRTMNRYLEELERMARLIPGTTTHGSRLTQIGEEDWELNLKVGFDGKEPVDYYSRKLSSGQKAAMSVMLLMAALRLDGTFSVMFLDEPAARLDDKRAKELGQLLRAAGAQIFITAPTSNSLLAMDWIDHALITTKKVAGARHAPPIKVRYLRTMRGGPDAQGAV